MKKSMLLVLALTAVLGGAMAHSNVEANDGLSDEEIVTAFAVDHFGDGDYDVVITDETNDERIYYEISGDSGHRGWILRSHHTCLYSEN